MEAPSESWKGKADYDHALARNLLGLEQFSEQVAAERSLVLEGIKDYGTGTIRSLFLLNGGASLASLTFISTLLGRSGGPDSMAAVFSHKMGTALTFFGAGLAFAVASSGCAYLNFCFAYMAGFDRNAMFEQTVGRPIPEPNRWAFKALWVAALLSILLAIMSLLAFARGGRVSFHALNEAARATNAAAHHSK